MRMASALMLLGLLGAIACGPSKSSQTSPSATLAPPPIAEPEMSVSKRIISVLSVPDDAAASALVQALAADWEREAGDGEDRADILDVLVEDLTAAASGVAESDHLALLQARVSGRRVRQLDAASYDLAERAHVEGHAGLEDQASALRQRLDGLSAEVRDRVDPRWRAALQSSLQRVGLELAWVETGGEGPTSARLGRRIAQDAPAPDLSPDLSP